MVTVNIMFIIICLAFAMIVVLQMLNRQELLAQRDDIEMIRFRLKTINSLIEQLNVSDDSTGEEVPDAEPNVENKEQFRISHKPKGVIKEGYFEFHPTDDKIEYEEENFIIEEE